MQCARVSWEGKAVSLTSAEPHFLLRRGDGVAVGMNILEVAPWLWSLVSWVTLGN